MLYITSIRINKTEIVEEYTKTYSLTDTHLVEANNEDAVKDKITLYYQNQQSESTIYDITFISIHNTIV
jgi:hypothetical protein